VKRLSENRKELFQTIASLTALMEKGLATMRILPEYGR